MKLTTSTAATYAAMLARLLPRGPIWDRLNTGLGGILTALGAELNEVHARMVDVMDEVYPATADELLDDWLRVWGLPAPCSTMPATADGKRELLAGKVAAQGGQSRAYFIALGRAVLGDLTADVTVEELPGGEPFRVSVSRVGDRLVGVGSVHHWILHMPSYTTDSQMDAIDCLVQKFKPAQTVATVVRGLNAYYTAPGGVGDYAEASTNVAARLIFPGGGIGTFTVLMWAQQPTSSGLSLWTCGTWGDDFYESGRDGPSRLNHEVGVYDASFTASALSFTTPDTDEWFFQAETCDGSTIRAYVNGTEADNAAVAGTFTAQDVLALFCARADNYFVGGSEGSLRNIAIFDRALTADEIAELYAAGMTHDYRDASGADWAGETPPIYWCTGALSRRVENSGDGGTCDLILNSAVTSEEDA